MMYQCWHGNPDERPTFSQLQIKISAVLSSMADYLEFSEIAPCDEIDEVRTLLSCTNDRKLGRMACEVLKSVIGLTKL